jgi:hypothetical protein
MLLSTLISPLAVVVAETFEDVSNCRALNVPSWLWSFWVVFLVFECLLCYLAVSKVYERIQPQSPYARGSLRNVLLRDSALYYISCVLLFADLRVSMSQLRNRIVVIYSINLFFWIRDLVEIILVTSIPTD